jgi:hypothetical protein
MTSNLLIAAYLTVAAASCATAAKAPASETPKEAPKPASNTVNGYDFAGPQTLVAPKPGMICTMELKPEQAACHEAGGKAIKADKCRILCSVPIKSKNP